MSNNKKIIELTEDQCNLLVCYLIMTTNHRKGEREAWEKLAKETNEDGTPTFKHAQSNAQYWEELDYRLEEIRYIIDKAY